MKWLLPGKYTHIKIWGMFGIYHILTWLWYLTPVSQMEVGYSRIWGLVPTTQIQVSGTPHKPALPATQPQAQPATPDPKSSTRHPEQGVQWKKKTLKERPRPLPWVGRGNSRKHTSANTPNAEPSKTTRTCAGACINMQRSRWPLELPKDAMEKRHMEIIHAHAKNAASTPPKYW